MKIVRVGDVVQYLLEGLFGPMYHEFASNKEHAAQ